MLLRVKSAAHVPDEAQLLPFVQAQEQRPKRNRLRTRLRPTAHDSINRLTHFQLRPIRAAVAHINAIAALRDNPFEPALPSQPEQFFSMLQLMIEIAKTRRRVQQALQQLLALE